MDGIHDLGGKHGFGQVVREVNEPAFHERWEAAVYAMVGAARRAGAYDNVDRFRHAVERIDPVAYLSHTYYGRWLGGLETLLVEAGVLETGDIDARALQLGASPDDLVAARPASAPDPVVESSRVATAQRDVATAPGFAVGDRIVTHIDVKAGHTRLPAYARGRPGIVRACRGAWVYPDTNAHGRGEHPQYLYSIEFEGSALWGESSEPALKVYIDLFEPYLRPAEAI